MSETWRKRAFIVRHIAEQKTPFPRSREMGFERKSKPLINLTGGYLSQLVLKMPLSVFSSSSRGLQKFPAKKVNSLLYFIFI